MCIDPDNDGHGFQCAAGEDCDESDPSVFEGCMACSKPAEGCACELDAVPIDCELPKILTSSGGLLCRTGTRYCRDGVWSGCEGIKSFEAPPPSRFLANALIDSGAAETCGPCSPDCYQLNDPLNTGDASSLGPNVVPGDGGGITLAQYTLDGGMWNGDTGVLDEIDCSPGGYPDFECDGIPDEYDPYPKDPPFASDHETIFMDLGPGDQQSKTFEIEFYVNTVDIYLYLDMTGSMVGELTNLIDSLNTDNYMPASWSGPCRDRNRNKINDQEEEDLKEQGITGNIACMIRDSSFGTGWHRDLPFPRPDEAGFGYGPADFEMFQHEQDMTADVDLVLGALNRFETRGGINRPEGGIMGLYALATGSQLYAGWDRPGNPARNCDDGYWGYPCFRNDAVPIVIWMTDAPVTNGPVPEEGHLGEARTEYCRSNCGSLWQSNYDNTQPVSWDPDSLGIEVGTGAAYTEVTGHDTRADADADPLGSVNDSFRTYYGSTYNMATDVTYENMAACQVGSAWSTSTQTAPDAVFRFSVTENEPITISTRGSRFRTAIAIVDTDRIGLTVPSTAAGASTNGSPGSTALNLNTPSFPQNVTGSISSSSAVFTRDALGSCLAQDTSSSDKAGAAVLRFRLAQDVPQLYFTSDSTFSVATALFAGVPGVPTDTSLTTISVPYGTGNRTGNSNDYFGGYYLGDVKNLYRRFTGGSTSDSDLANAQFSASKFSGFAACSGVNSSGRDATFDFYLGEPRRMRFEVVGDNDRLQAGFDHVLALVSRRTLTHAVAATNYTDATAAAVDVSELLSYASDPSVWSAYKGVLGGSSTQYSQSEVGPFAVPSASHCGNNSAAPDGTYQAVFSMDMTGLPTTAFDFNTLGSGDDTWLSIHEAKADTQGSVTLTTNNPNNNHNTGSGYADLGTLDETSVYVKGGNINGSPTVQTGSEDYVSLSTMGCSGSGNGGRDAVYRFTLDANQAVSITLGSSTGTAANLGGPGFSNAYLAVFRSSLSSANRVAGGCSTGTSLTTGNLTAGTYYVVVKVNTTTNPSNGSYGLWVRDTTFLTTFNTLYPRVCDYGSEQSAASLTNQTLTTGKKYYIVIKGASNTSPANAYQLNVRRHGTDPAMLACDRNSGGTNHAVIERDLPAGYYSLIVKGYTTSNGAYQLVMRDLSVAPNALGCAYDASSSPGVLSVSNLTANDSGGVPIDYYLVMRANSSGSSGSYSMVFEDHNTAPTYCAYDNVTMTTSRAVPAAFPSSETTYSRSDDINNAEWTGTLPLGDYYVVIKGYDASDSTSTYKDNDKGIFQLTIGDQTNHETFGTFDAKSWLGPASDGAGGVLEALKAKNIHVITVDSTSGSGDDATYSDQQLRTIAKATGAVDTDGNELFFQISSDGSGLGSAIVQAVYDLSETLAMDVGVQLVEEPQSPAPKHFGFKVRAIDQLDDSCDPPTEDRDNDPEHIPDTHVQCLPSATPRFEISFTNPTPPNHVEPNPDDPLGGWTMKLRLIGRDGTLNDDGTPKTYYLDEIPVYIIPEDVVAQPGEERYNASGTYEQTMDSAKCLDNESPLWRSLYWEGDLPSGTSLTWKVCTADTEQELASCSLQTAATFRSGIECTEDSQCPNGYCEQVMHRCEFATGPSCSGNSDCGANGSCVSGSCSWSQKPIDVKPALARGLQGKAFARVQVTLTSNAAQTRAPSITSWYLRYTCAAQE